MNLEQEITEIKQKLDAFVRPDSYQFLKDLNLPLTAKIRGFLYGGSVNENGSTDNLPEGWTSANTGTGAYTVTHNLGRTDHIVIPVCSPTNTSNSSIYMAKVSANSANSFSVHTSNITTDANSAFYFILMRI